MRDESLATWWGVISGARWFAGKGEPATLTDVTPLPWLTPPGSVPAVRPEIATVAYAARPAEQYQLLVGHLGGTEVVEAPADADCMRALLAALTASGHPAMEWFDRAAIDPDAPTRVWAGEQSNTTVCVGDDALFKLFRRLEPGRNLDVEVLGALNGSGVTPELYGVLSGELPDGRRADLGMFVERVQGVRDGWEWACEACTEGRAIATEAAELGQALRRLHDRLAEAFGTGDAPGAEVAAIMTGRLDTAAAQVGELAGVRTPVAAALRTLDGVRLPTQRVHGDFHLGQTLRSDHGWTIIDFEGEPLKSLAERRRPDSVWRDVAGMLRSFDYARSAHPDPTSGQALAWSASAREAFLDGYCEGAPPDAAVLDAYVLDKAIYEVVYETRNRPEWVHIPLRAVHDVAERTALSPTHNQKEN